MNIVDAAVLALLAFADILLLVHLRLARRRRLRDERMMRSLSLAVHRNLTARIPAPAVKEWNLHRAG